MLMLNVRKYTVIIKVDYYVLRWKLIINATIYGMFMHPNDESERKTFLIKMNNVVQDNSSDGHVIIGGDFNTVLNPVLDKIGGNIPNPMCANTIKNFLIENEIVDIWRVKHGNEKRVYLETKQSSRV